MDTRRHTGHRRRYKGNIKRIRQRNRRVGIFLLVLFVAAAGVINVVKTKHREAAAQAYAEQQAEKKAQAAKEKEEKEENSLKLADEKEKDQWYPETGQRQKSYDPGGRSGGGYGNHRCQRISGRRQDHG